MDWFQGFVDDVVKQYAALQAAATKVASFEERLDMILAEKAEKVESQFIGHVGERFVTELVRKQGHATARSRGSRSPADIWGVAHADGATHLSLTQVKTTRTGRTPALLSGDEEHALERFCEFVHALFSQSQKVPADLKSLPLAVSAGYAGVAFDLMGVDPTGYDCRYIGATASLTMPGGAEGWFPRLRAFHERLAG